MKIKFSSGYLLCVPVIIAGAAIINRFDLPLPALPISPSATSPEPKAVTPKPKAISLVTKKRTRLGVWVASVDNIDFFSRPGLPIEKQKAEITAIMEQSKALGIQDVYFQIRPAADALYKSDYEPWSHVIAGTQGTDPGYDPLEFAIEEAHKRKLKLHAWGNPYRAKTPNSPALHESHFAKRHPEAAYEYGDLLWLDPGQRIVQDQTYQTLMDVVRRYDVDGIHLDDYFYPYPKSGIPFPDSKTYAEYKEAGGTLSLGDWRRDNVNKLVKRLSKGIREVNAESVDKPHITFSISPFGIYRPGEPAGIVGLDQYNELYADVKKWLKEGWVDEIHPQLYWKMQSGSGQDYSKLLAWWKETAGSTPICVGLATYQIPAGEFTVDDVRRQLKEGRRQGVNCFILFRHKHNLTPQVRKLIKEVNQY